jgi:hypothetical protein
MGKPILHTPFTTFRTSVPVGFSQSDINNAVDAALQQYVIDHPAKPGFMLIVNSSSVAQTLELRGAAVTNVLIPSATTYLLVAGSLGVPSSIFFTILSSPGQFGFSRATSYESGDPSPLEIFGNGVNSPRFGNYASLSNVNFIACITDYVLPAAENEITIFNDTGINQTVHLLGLNNGTGYINVPIGQSVALKQSAFASSYPVVLSLPGGSSDINFTCYSGFTLNPSVLNKTDFLGLSVDGSQFSAAIAHISDLANGNMFAVIRKSDQTLINSAVSTVQLENPKRYFSCLNNTVVDHVLTVFSITDFADTVDYVIPAGKQFIFRADSAGLPDGSNEHYLKLTVGSAPVQVLLGSEDHAAASDPVTVATWPSGFVSGNICETVGLWRSSSWMVLNPSA